MAGGVLGGLLRLFVREKNPQRKQICITTTNEADEPGKLTIPSQPFSTFLGSVLSVSQPILYRIYPQNRFLHHILSAASLWVISIPSPSPSHSGLRAIPAIFFVKSNGRSRQGDFLFHRIDTFTTHWHFVLTLWSNYPSHLIPPRQLTCHALESIQAT